MANTYLSVVTMEIINQYSVMLPWDNVGARTSTAMSYMVQGSQVELQIALILVSSSSLCIDPETSNDMILLNCNLNKYNTRATNCFRLPYCRTNVRKFWLRFQIPKFCNSLRVEIQNVSSFFLNCLAVYGKSWSFCVPDDCFTVVLYISLSDFIGLPCLTDWYFILKKSINGQSQNTHAMPGYLFFGYVLCSLKILS